MSDVSLFADDPTAGHRTYTVGALAHEIGRTLQREFGTEVWVEGEMRNLKRSSAGHVYFDLVDPGEPGAQPTASLSVVLFRKTRDVVNAYLKASGGPRMDDGMAIRIRGTIDLYAPQGRLQLRMTGIDPTYTLGRLAADRERILAGLRDDDLLEVNGRLPFPVLPRRVALVTSAGSAAAEDFLSELRRSGVGWQVTLIDTRVQGFAAVDGICAALARAVHHGQVVAVVRGGGARTDLAAFDSDAVARAIAACPLPVVTGIGHEIDRTVADEVAAVATKTPTAAAAEIAERVHAVQHQLVADAARLAAVSHTRLAAADHLLSTHGQRADRAVTASARLADSRVDQCTDRLQRAADRRLALRQVAIDALGARLARTARRLVDRPERRLVQLEESIGRVDPVRLLRRGWSIVRTDAGELVRSVAVIRPGDTLVTTTVDGTATSTVIGTNHRGDLPT
jgi:exodeoxyribonuclease VII large subunit